MKSSKISSKNLFYVVLIFFLALSCILIFIPNTQNIANATSSPYQIGDFVSGFYYNTAMNPKTIFDAMNWNNANVKFFPTEEYEMIPLGYTELDIYYLVNGFTPPTTIEEMHGDDTQWLQLQIWRWVKDDGSVSYVFMQHGSHFIWVDESCPLIGGEIGAGWWFSNTDFDDLDYSTGVTTAYVAGEQNLWGQLVGKTPFV